MRSNFPIFKKYPELVYLDNAATTQKPESVIEALSHFYAYENANIHRGIYDLSNKATANFEDVRHKLAEFIKAVNPETIAFTRGTTESMNVIARTFLADRLNSSKNIVTTLMEHHANFIPWQMAAKAAKAELRVAKLNNGGDIDLEHLYSLMDQNTAIVTLNHISNTLGSINPVKEIIEKAHDKNIPVMLDAAQSAAYYNISQEDLQYDFLTFSAHKLFGPFGIGMLYVSPQYKNYIKPYNYGGGIIQDVKVENTTFRAYPYNLDAGTPNVGGVIGMGAAIDFINSYDKKEVSNQIHSLISYAEKKLSEVPEVKIIGKPKKRSGIISFTVDNVHPHDVATFLNKDHIAVRAGMHCTQPLLDSLQIPATVRLSLSVYNEKEDIDKLVVSLKEIIELWS